MLTLFETGEDFLEKHDCDDEFIDDEDEESEQESTSICTRGQHTSRWFSGILPAERRANIDKKKILHLKIPTPVGETSFHHNFLSMFFDHQIMEYVIHPSRTYHSQRNLKCPELNEPLLMRFMGYLLYSGCIKMPGKVFYWQKPTRKDLVANNFTSLQMNRTIAQIHFADNSKRPGQHFYKMEHVVQLVDRKIQDVVKQERFIAMEVQMTCCKSKKGPTGLSQYVPIGPTPHVERRPKN